MHFREEGMHFRSFRRLGEQGWEAGRSRRRGALPCYVGFANVRILRPSRKVDEEGEIVDIGEEKVELSKQRMIDHSLYALALSEVRRDGGGSLDVGDGFTFVLKQIGAYGGRRRAPGTGGV